MQPFSPIFNDLFGLVADSLFWREIEARNASVSLLQVLVKSVELRVPAIDVPLFEPDLQIDLEKDTDLHDGATRSVRTWTRYFKQNSA